MILRSWLPAPCHLIDTVTWLDFSLDGRVFFYHTAFTVLWGEKVFHGMCCFSHCHALVVSDCRGFFVFFCRVCLHARAHSGRKSRRHRHFQVPLHAQHCRHQNEDFCDFHEHIPALKHQVENTAHKVRLHQHTIDSPHIYAHVFHSNQKHSGVHLFCSQTDLLISLLPSNIFFYFQNFFYSWCQKCCFFNEAQENTVIKNTKNITHSIVFASPPHLNQLKQNPSRHRPKTSQQEWHQDLK